MFQPFRDSFIVRSKAMSHRWWNGWMRPQPPASRRGRATAKPTWRSILALEALENRTVPSFAAVTAFDLGAAPNAVAVGHFEGAGAPLDVVTANANGTVSVLLGKGDGTIQNPISITVGGTPDAVAVGDFTGNGLDDIVVANANGTVTVLLSNSNNTFKAPETLSLATTPLAVGVGDFTGDGKPDLVTANSNGTISVLPGKGDGTFNAAIATQVGDSFTSLAVGDFNRDGKPDLAVGTSTGLDILLGKGSGTFQLKQRIPFFADNIPEAVTAVAVSDLLGNGKQDIVALSDAEPNVLLGNGDGTFQAPVQHQPGGVTVRSFVVGDFNGDGKPDIVTSNNAPPYGAPATLTFLAGSGDGTFRGHTVTIGETATTLVAGDFRGDGKLDLVLETDIGSNTVTVVPGNGNGTFALTPSYPAGPLPEHIAAADFNGDGKPDLVVTDEGGGAEVLLNNGDGTFHAGPTLPDSSIADAVVVGDFRDDGKQDIALGNQDGTIDVFLGNGNGTVQAAKVFTVGSSDVIRSLVAGDFNHDGRLDLAVTVDLQNNQETGEVIVLLGNGTGTFKTIQTINVGTDALGLAAADFNGDGKLDLVTTTMLPDGTRDVKVLLGNGTGTFQALISTPTGFRPTSVATGDFNGDGKPDLVLLDYFANDNSVLVMRGNGNGMFQKPLAFKFNTPVGFATPVVGDFFGAGKLSVAVTTGVGNVTVLRGNGDGTFQAPVNYLADFNGSQPNALVVADFNGDGKPDLAVTNAFAGDVSVLLNTSPKPISGTVATKTALVADVNPAVFGQPVTLTATVTAASSTPTGTITFFDGTTALGEVALDPNGQARLLVQLSAGTHSLKAIFAGIAPFTGSTSALSETVNKAATTNALSVAVDPFGFTDAVVLTATVAPVAPGAGVPTGTVTFFEGGKILGTAQLDSNGQAGVFLERFPPGAHTVTAVYSGDGDFMTSTSEPVPFTEP
jgi:hypothetical protein